MGRKPKQPQPNCLTPPDNGTVYHDYKYIADDYSHNEEGYWEIYKCTLCNNSITIKVSD